jgi:AraC-like DNA-binding protein
MHSGFQFCSFDANMTHASRIYSTDPSEEEDRVVLMLVTSLQGSYGVKPGGHSNMHHINAGHAVAYSVPEPNMIIDLPASQQRGFDAGFSRSLLQRIGSDTPLPVAVRRLAEGNKPRPFTMPGSLDGRLGMLINDLMTTNYTGSALRIYQEAKGLELIALLLDALENRKSKRYTRWKRRDIALLHEAKVKLTINLENPPSMVELANSIGMSPTKLKLGFREVLGTTVTDTLRNARLHLARSLLETSDLPLKAIAGRCGFCDASSLSHAFSSHYGLNPGELRRS